MSILSNNEDSPNQLEQLYESYASLFFITIDDVHLDYKHPHSLYHINSITPKHKLKIKHSDKGIKKFIVKATPTKLPPISVAGNITQLKSKEKVILEEFKNSQDSIIHNVAKIAPDSPSFHKSDDSNESYKEYSPPPNNFKDDANYNKSNESSSLVEAIPYLEQFNQQNSNADIGYEKQKTITWFVALFVLVLLMKLWIM